MRRSSPTERAASLALAPGLCASSPLSYLWSCSQIPTDQKYDGHSFLPQIKGLAGQKREWVFCHYQPLWSSLDKMAGRWVQTVDYKLYNDGRFYDLKNDLLEKSPLVINSEKLKTLRTKLQSVLDHYQKEAPYLENKSHLKKKKKANKKKKV